MTVGKISRTVAEARQKICNCKLNEVKNDNRDLHENSSIFHCLLANSNYDVINFFPQKKEESSTSEEDKNSEQSGGKKEEKGKQTESKEKSKKDKDKRNVKAVKNSKLLSFGDDEEEEDE